MRQLPLSRNKYTLIDDSDFEWLSQWKWTCFKDRRGRYYAKRNIYFLKAEKKKPVNVAMHRLIMNPLGKMQVDHINGDTLDNRRANLRVCTQQQNGWARKKQSNGKAKYKGIFWNKFRNRWQAQLRYNGKAIYLGRSKDQEIAARLYDKGARQYYGEFANCNFSADLSRSGA